MAPTLRRYCARRDSAHCTRVGSYLALHHPEHTPAAWDQLVRGRENTPRRFVAILEAAVALSDQALIARLMAPVEATLAAAPIPTFGSAVVLAAQQADVSEDEREAVWHADPSPDHLRAWLRAIDAQAAASRVLRQSIAHHLEATT